MSGSHEPAADSVPDISDHAKRRYRTPRDGTRGAPHAGWRGKTCRRGQVNLFAARLGDPALRDRRLVVAPTLRNSYRLRHSSRHIKRLYFSDV